LGPRGWTSIRGVEKKSAPFPSLSKQKGGGLQLGPFFWGAGLDFYPGIWNKQGGWTFIRGGNTFGSESFRATVSVKILFPQKSKLKITADWLVILSVENRRPIFSDLSLLFYY